MLGFLVLWSFLSSGETNNVCIAGVASTAVILRQERIHIFNRKDSGPLLEPTLLQMENRKSL